MISRSAWVGKGHGQRCDLAHESHVSTLGLDIWVQQWMPALSAAVGLKLIELLVGSGNVCHERRMQQDFRLPAVPVYGALPSHVEVAEDEIGLGAPRADR